MQLIEQMGKKVVSPLPQKFRIVIVCENKLNGQPFVTNLINVLGASFATQKRNGLEKRKVRNVCFATSVCDLYEYTGCLIVK